MMRAYTLSVLQRLAGSDKPITDPEIVEWTNTTLQSAGKSSSINGFKDPAIATSMPVIDLVDAIKPGSIKYDLVVQGGSLSDEVIMIDMMCVYMCISVACSNLHSSHYDYSAHAQGIVHDHNPIHPACCGPYAMHIHCMWFG